MSPFKIWDAAAGNSATGNLYYTDGVGSDGLFYAGVMTRLALTAWDDVPSDPMAGLGFKYATNEYAGAYQNLGKAVMKPLDGVMYSSNVTTAGGFSAGLYKIPSWGTVVPVQVTNSDASNPGLGFIEAMCNDGTYFYTTVCSGTQSWSVRTKIHKWSINKATNTATEITTGGWPVTVSTSGSSVYPTGLSYDPVSKNIYAVDGGTTSASPGKVWEIDTTAATATAVSTGLSFAYGGGATNGSLRHAVRYGNQLFVLLRNVGTTSPAANLFVYDKSGATWTQTAAMNLPALAPYSGGDCYAIGLKGNGTTARYAWVTHVGAYVAFYDLYSPFSGTAGDLSDLSWKFGYPAYVQAVVTVRGTGGFWIENQKRTTGAWVPWTGTMPTVGNLVTIKAKTSKNASGENILTPLDANSVVEGAPAQPAVKPIMLTNKTLGPASDSVGLGNAGMLVSIYGKMTGTTVITETPGAMYIDDGSGVASGIEDPAKGVKIMMADGSNMCDYDPVAAGLSAFLAGSKVYVKVTGIARLESVGGIVIRRIDARSASDIVMTVVP